MPSSVKKATEGAATAASGKLTKGQPRSVTVRMFNVGFGDCFLIKFPDSSDPERSRTVLVDCGTVARGSIGMRDVVSSILEETTVDSKPARIDVVVCTHRHRDHVSGFTDGRWAKVEVGEVWFPWTEDANDKEASRIRKDQTRLAQAMELHWSKGSSRAAAWRQMAANALSNEDSMAVLHNGFSGTSRAERRYLSSEGAPKEISTSVLPGVRAYVLGPSRDPDVIRDMNPPAGSTYLRWSDGREHASMAIDPFGSAYFASAKAVKAAGLDLTGADRESIAKLSSQLDPALTVALDQAVNGTSLVLAFEIDGLVLFFPGDAQWGTWNAILNNDASKQLLSRSSLWKVGHHGSHNATPKRFLNDTVRPGCCAMVSTLRTKRWPSVPRDPLLDEIVKKGLGLFRSDERDPSKRRPNTVETASFSEIAFPLPE